MLDINTCSQADIRRILGIHGIADRIIKYRRLNGSYKNFNELRRVCGATRAELHTISKHFRIGDLSCEIELKRPQQGRMSFTKSIADFVCKGKSLTGSGLNTESTDDLPSRMAQNGAQYRRVSDKRENNYLIQEDRILDSFRVCQKHHDTSLKISRDTNEPKKGESTEKFKPRQKSADILTRDAFLQHVEAEEVLYRLGKEGSLEKGSTNEAAIKIQTAQSGDKVSFPCNTDKQFLKCSSSVAFHADRNLRAASRNAKEVKNTVPSPEIVHNIEASSFTDREHMSICTCASSRLSEENLSRHEKNTMQSRADKKSAVEAWVVEVNVAKNLEAIHKRKRSPVAICRNSGRRTVSPPVKKLLKRYGLDCNVQCFPAPDCHGLTKVSHKKKPVSMMVFHSPYPNPTNRKLANQDNAKAVTTESSIKSDSSKQDLCEEANYEVNEKELTLPLDATKSSNPQHCCNNNNMLPQLDSSRISNKKYAIRKKHFPVRSCQCQLETSDLDIFEGEEGCVVM